MKMILPKIAFAAFMLVALPCHAEIVIQDAFSPHQGATGLIVKTIESAKQSVLVAAYSFTSKPIAAALVRAHQRGVQVKVVLDEEANRDDRMAEFLATNGVDIRINGRYHIMHNKFMVIDDDAVELGSFNYTYAAERENAENIVVIRGDKALATDYPSQWGKLWGEARN